MSINRDSYNAVAARWDAARSGFYGRERDYLATLLDGLPTGSRVLDLGCGTGRPLAEQVLAAGHQLTGVDQAEVLLAIARERLPAGTWLHGRIEDFESDQRFDALICWDALFHIERRWHAPLIARFARLLVPGGRLMLTCGGSEHAPFTDTMFDHLFAYDSHPPQTVLELLAAQGFVPRISEFMNPPTGGRDKGRYAVVAQRSP